MNNVVTSSIREGQGAHSRSISSAVDSTRSDLGYLAISTGAALQAGADEILDGPTRSALRAGKTANISCARFARGSASPFRSPGTATTISAPRRPLRGRVRGGADWIRAPSTAWRTRPATPTSRSRSSASTPLPRAVELDLSKAREVSNMSRNRQVHRRFLEACPSANSSSRAEQRWRGRANPSAVAIGPIPRDRVRHTSRCARQKEWVLQFQDQAQRTRLDAPGREHGAILEKVKVAGNRRKAVVTD